MAPTKIAKRRAVSHGEESKPSSARKKAVTKSSAPKTPRRSHAPAAPAAAAATAWTSSDEDEEDEDSEADAGERQHHHHHHDAGGCCGSGDHQSLPQQPVPFFVDDDRPTQQVQNVAKAAAQGSPTTQPGSEAAGAAVLSALLAPLPLRAFFDTCFEERPVLVRRGRAGGRKRRQGQGCAVVEGLFGSSDLFDLLQEHDYPPGTGVDIVRFDREEGVRRTLNDAAVGSSSSSSSADGVSSFVRPADLRDALLRGESARILHPQRHHAPLRSVVAALEGFWGCAVGSNAYISPPLGHQGFAPHYDDVDVFIVQLCGRKRWRAFGPRTEEEVLPRWPSDDFREEELGPLLLDAVMRRGDVLYLPRGTVHCAATVGDEKERGEDDDDEEEEEEGEGSDDDDVDGGAMLPSLHLTISVSQRNTWADFLAVALPRAVELAAASNVELRRSLPRGLLASCLGVAREDAAERAAAEEEEEEVDEASPVVPGGTAPRAEYARRARNREAALAVLQQAALAVVAALPVDAAADRVGADFLLSRMRPTDPMVAAAERERQKDKRKKKKAPLPSLVVPACGGTAARLCVEGDSAVVYHCLANESEAHAAGGGGSGETTLSSGGRIELPLEAAPALELLLGVHSARPGVDAVRVSDLPGFDEDEDEDDRETASAVREALEALLEAGVVVEVGEGGGGGGDKKEKRRTKKSK